MQSTTENRFKWNGRKPIDCVRPHHSESNACELTTKNSE